MSSDDQHDLEVLEEVLSLPDDSPRRGELLARPQVRALYDSYLLFSEPGAEIEADHVGRAAEMEPVVPAAPAGSPDRPGSVRNMPRRRTGRPAWPTRIPVFAAAAAMLIASAILIPRWMGEGSRGLLRGTDLSTIEVETPRIGRDTIEFVWSPVEGATAYELRVTTLDFVETDRLPALQPRLTVPRRRWPTSPDGQPLLWRVVALKGGEEIASSSSAELPAP